MNLPCALALILLALDDRPTAPASPTPLNASVMIFNEWGLRSAAEQVGRIARTGQGKVNFVVTIHCQLDAQLRPLDYGLIRAEEGWHYTPFDDELLRAVPGLAPGRLRRGGQTQAGHRHPAARRCRRPAVRLAEPLPPRPAGRLRGLLLRAGPDRPHRRRPGGHRRAETGVEFALTGEMGRTVFAYPMPIGGSSTGLRRRKGLGALRPGSASTSTMSPGVAAHGRPARLGAGLLGASDFLGFSAMGWWTSRPTAVGLHRDCRPVRRGNLKGAGSTRRRGWRCTSPRSGSGAAGRRGDSRTSARPDARGGGPVALVGDERPGGESLDDRPMRDFRRPTTGRCWSSCGRSRRRGGHGGVPLGHRLGGISTMSTFADSATSAAAQPGGPGPGMISGSALLPHPHEDLADLPGLDGRVRMRPSRADPQAADVMRPAERMPTSMPPGAPPGR